MYKKNIFLAVIVFSTPLKLALASNEQGFPGAKEIYERIEQSTGLSLREVFNALFHDKNQSISKSNYLSEKFDLSSMKRALDKDVNAQTKYCLQKYSKIHCDTIGDSAQMEWKKFTIQYEKAKSNPLSVKSFLPQLLIYRFKVGNEALSENKKNWEKSCGSSKTINTSDCKKSFAILSGPEEIIDDMVGVATLKRDSKVVDFQIERSLDVRIGNYEKP